MPTHVATHNGPFHADDVLAWALVRAFHDPHATVVRTRDPDVLARADLVFDVGGVYDPSALRFDHHQASYDGPLSSAGMVLGWLADTDRVAPALAARLRRELVDYVDAVDNGRLAPRDGVPCFARIVEALNQGARSLAEFDERFLQAGELALAYVRGIEAGHHEVERARGIVQRAMAEAEAEGRAVIHLPEYARWKPPYFEAGGAEHPTDYVLFPGNDGSWRVVAIPPEPGSFAQKRPLPSAWAGLSGADLEQVTGVPGSIFCHKNRFIAVFDTREHAVEALRRHGLDRRG